MKEKKGGLFIIIALLFMIIGFFLFNLGLLGYSVFTFTFGGVLFLGGLFSISNNSTPTKRYESEVRSILNTYDSILVKSNSVPNIEGRNIIMVESIDDIIDAQLEIRKPVCYLKQTESCSFVLLDDKEVYIYIEKLRDDVVSPVEIAIKEAKIKSKSRDEMDSEMLRDIEKTTVVKLSNKKSYKVSPIRKKEKEKSLKEEKNIVVENLLGEMENPKEGEIEANEGHNDQISVETLNIEDELFEKNDSLDEIEVI